MLQQSQSTGTSGSPARRVVARSAVVFSLLALTAACGGGATPGGPDRSTASPRGPATVVETPRVTAVARSPATPAAASVRRVVAISAGHGGPRNVGATHTGADGRVDLVEKDLNLEIARRVDALLRARGYATAMLRDGDYALAPEASPGTTDGVRAESQARADAANAAQADVLLVVHFNGSEDRAQSGSEVYFDPDRPFGERSRRLASALHDQLVAALRALRYDVRDRGVKDDAAIAGRYRQPHTFLFGEAPGFRSTRMPAALVEGLFVTNDADAAMLLRDETRDAIARAYATAIDRYFAE